MPDRLHRTHFPDPISGNSKEPAAKATTGKPRAAANDKADIVPLLSCTTKPTTPAEAEEITLKVRQESRPRTGTDKPPPESQDTDPPAVAKAETVATAETPQAPEPSTSKAAKHLTEETKEAVKEESNTSSSAPREQPTTIEPPRRTRAEQTRHTTGANAEDNERDPTTAKREELILIMIYPLKTPS
jgi:hypothetical protein